MGFFDEILSDFKTITDEIQDLKQEFVSQVIDPSGELRNTVKEFTDGLQGNGGGSASDASSLTDASSATDTKSIQVTDGNDTP